MDNLKKKIQEWWNRFPCNSKSSRAEWGTRQFYEQVDADKDAHEPFTNLVADYANWRNKTVLEVGCGLGKEFSRFISAGASAIAIDLSMESIRLTAKRLKIFGLNGALCLADAENLPFKDSSFDFVFSWGVLHHTPDTQKAIDEAYRCVKGDGGKITVMLYNKYSVTNLRYLICHIRNRLYKIKKRIFFWRRFYPATMPLENLNAKQFMIAATDGEGNPISKRYSIREASRMFGKFKNVRIITYERIDNLGVKTLGRFKFFQKYLGWCLTVTAEK